MPEPTRTSSWKKSFGEVKSFMLKAVNDLMSFNDFYDTAREAGISYQRQRMLRDWDSVRGLYAHEEHIHTLNPELAIGEYDVSKEFYTKNYNYLAGVEYKYFDVMTQTWETGMRMIDMDALQTPNEILTRAIDVFGADSPYRDPSATDFKLRYVIGRSA